MPGRSAGQGVRCGGHAAGAGLGNRFTQELDQRVVDARVCDAGRREQKPHDARLGMLLSHARTLKSRSAPATERNGSRSSRCWTTHPAREPDPRPPTGVTHVMRRGVFARPCRAVNAPHRPVMRPTGGKQVVARQGPQNASGAAARCATARPLRVTRRLAEAQVATAAGGTTLDTDVPTWAVLIRVAGFVERTLQRAGTDVAAVGREVALAVVTAAASLAAGAIARVATTGQRRLLRGALALLASLVPVAT